jgi:hypothetical protein
MEICLYEFHNLFSFQIDENYESTPCLEWNTYGQM